MENSLVPLNTIGVCLDQWLCVNVNVNVNVFSDITHCAGLPEVQQLSPPPPPESSAHSSIHQLTI